MRHSQNLPRGGSTGHRATLVAVGAALTLAALAGACGNSSGRASSQPPISSTIVAPTKSPGTPTGSPTSLASRAAAAVVIRNYKFVPADMTVAPGETIRVRNDDSVTHTVTAVTSSGKAFDTGSIDPGATAIFTAPRTAGSYPYICSIHPFMRGIVTVS